MYKLSESEKQNIVSLYTTGMSASELSAFSGHSTQVIARVLEEYGAIPKSKPDAEQEPRLTVFNIEEKREMRTETITYRRRGELLVKIAAMLELLADDIEGWER